MNLLNYAHLQEFGYSDCFYLNGILWGFLHDDVMPQLIPLKIIVQAQRKGKEAQWKEREKWLAQWPKFSRRQRFMFWRDRTLQNFKLKFFSPVSTYSPFGNVVFPYQKSLILGNRILCYQDADQIEHSECDTFYQMANFWKRMVNIQSIEPIQFGAEEPAFVTNLEIEGSDRVLVTACIEECHLKNHEDDSDYWIITCCNMDLAKAISQRIGYPARYFYALPSHLFWIYFKIDRKLILGAIENEENCWKALKKVFGIFSKPSCLLFFSIIIISQFSLPYDPIVSIVIFVLRTLFLICFLRDIKLQLEEF